MEHTIGFAFSFSISHTHTSHNNLELSVQSCYILLKPRCSLSFVFSSILLLLISLRGWNIKSGWIFSWRGPKGGICPDGGSCFSRFVFLSLVWEQPTCPVKSKKQRNTTLSASPGSSIPPDVHIRPPFPGTLWCSTETTNQKICCSEKVLVRAGFQLPACIWGSSLTVTAPGEDAQEVYHQVTVHCHSSCIRCRLHPAGRSRDSAASCFMSSNKHYSWGSCVFPPQFQKASDPFLDQQ